MAAKIIKAATLLRRGTALLWEQNNTVLLEGQLGVVMAGDDYGKCKLGDGATGWKDLPWIIGTDGKAATIQIAGVETVEFNLPASVVNEGTENAANFKFFIPRGVPGVTVPDITGLNEKTAAAPDDLLYLYDIEASAIKKISFGNLAQALLNIEYPVGSLYVQYPSGFSPVQKGMPGTWEEWSYRASLYAIGDTAPSEGFKADWKTYRHDIWSLNTDGTVATAGTKKYTKPGGYTCVERQELQPDWGAEDLTEGTLISGGPYDGRYIWQVIAFAGIFFGVEDIGYEGGGKRPTFVSGGAQEGRIINATGTFRGTHGVSSGEMNLSGIVYEIGQAEAGNASGGGHGHLLGIDISRAVPTGPDNAPTHISVRFWRRMPDSV
jgi:hypothetical protein